MAKLMLHPINSKVSNVGLGVFLVKNSSSTYFISKGCGVGFQCMSYFDIAYSIIKMEFGKNVARINKKIS